MGRSGARGNHQNGADESLACRPGSRCWIWGLWVYTTKRDLQGNILKYKVLGNLLPLSEELYAPTASVDTIRILLSLAAGN
eukprot:126137-Hanusia_phi.AAC.1